MQKLFEYYQKILNTFKPTTPALDEITLTEKEKTFQPECFLFFLLSGMFASKIYSLRL